MKYSLKIVIVACSYVCSSISEPAHPPRVKYSLYANEWLEDTTSNCNWVTLTLNFKTITAWPSPSQTSKQQPARHSLEPQQPSRTSTPSQSETFSGERLSSWRSVTAAGTPSQTGKTKLCSYIAAFHGGIPYLFSLLALVLAFQDQHTLPSEIFSHSCYCGLLVYGGLSGPAHPPKVKYSLTAVIVACSYTVAFQDQHTLPK